MDLKKNLFWIALVLVVLVGAVLWFMYVPPVEAKTEEIRKDCQSEAKHFKDLADQAGKDDVIKTDKHVKLAEKFSQKLADQLNGLKEDLKSRKLDLRFDDAPMQSGQFDIWLSELRQKITKQATDAGLQLPPDVDKLMFKDPATDENSHRVELHRSYRLRQMAIVQEVVDILSKKYGKQQVLKFQPDANTPEPQEQADAGAIALERVSIAWPKTILASASAPEERGGGVAAANPNTSEARARTIMEEALKRSGAGSAAKAGPASKALAPTYSELPYDVTSLDVQFVAPLSVVPAIAKALESSNRWTGVVSRIEYERFASPYPALTEPKLAKAGPIPGLNTHYQEGAVRALVSLDLYEYDEAKAKAAAAAATAATATGAAKKGATKK